MSNNTSDIMYINSYRPEGQLRNDVCVMIHGIFGMSANLLSLAKGLSGDVYPLLVDLPNHGNSPTMSPCDFIAMAKMLHRTIEAQNFSEDTNIHVLGHSLGGKLAMVYALLYPETTASLVVMDIAPVSYPPLHNHVIEAFHKVEESKPENRMVARDILIQYGIDKDTSSFLAKNFIFDEQYVGSKMRVHEIEKDYTNVLCHFPHEILEKKTYTKPTFFLRAEVSEYFSDEYVYEIDKYFPSWEVESIENSGHNIHIDNPTETKALITGFYREIR